jgi:hypothetical protein
MFFTEFGSPVTRVRGEKLPWFFNTRGRNSCFGNRL